MISRLYIALIALIALITLTPLHAFSEEPENRWHIGLDAMHTSINYASINYASLGTVNFNDIYASSLNGFGLRFGWRIGPHLGWEMGYYTTFEAQKNDIPNSKGHTKIRLNSLTWDVLGFFPLDDNSRSEIIGSIGFSNTTAEAEISTGSSAITPLKESEIKPRIGIGLKYSINQNLGIRTMARWQDASFTKVANGAYIVTLGIDYSL